ncbi:DUF3857 domain-containing protein [Flavobacterium kingsejongi]|uniref:DUF3857 domain-containing protein n=1 Tax=Flavobacterium kingsejongi TaxID=1678728 RepID=A0A2S1LNC2_9FLAO|nr:DUF3857 domain-containing protein [Flavobacterium kingsejongi]AWG25171.1 DUF3857 domain-containing protein [Flavobacterium kingsejongi]
MKNILLFMFLGSWTLSVSAQNTDYTVSAIAPVLKENANAVIRLNQKVVVISSRKSLNTKNKKVITVLNDNGLSHLGAYEYFDKSTRVKSIEAVVLNAAGKEIKKIRSKDFKESALSDGATITDNRIIALDYTPTEYPFTIVYESETESSNTAFIPSWYPINASFMSVENASISITTAAALGFKYKEVNIAGNEGIIKEEKNNTLTYKAQNLQAVKSEEYAPSFQNILPHVMFGLDNFNLEGVEGVATNWKEFGSWMYSNLLEGTDEIPAATQTKIKALVGDEKDPVKIAKIIYGYVQNKTRYVSIQLGIGGWKPMLAKDVDRLGYGDCKALSNYTRALLKVVNVPSYYTVIYGDTQRQDLQQDFVSMQGNHVILALPVGDKMYWLECTSQVSPFGFQGDFTDNRLALIVKPEGGEIIRTREYTMGDNTQISKGTYQIDEKGGITGTLQIKSKGTQYDNKYGYSGKSNEDLNKFYKRYFGNINNLKLKKINLSNNKEEIEFLEELTLEATEYGNIAGGKLMFALNAFNQVNGVPQRYRNRNHPFEISRGFSDYDEVVIDLPKGYSIEAKPENFELKDAFGEYKTEYIVINENQLLYKRFFQTNGGSYQKDQYENFRKFRDQVARNDNAKIVLAKIQ